MCFIAALNSSDSFLRLAARSSLLRLSTRSISLMSGVQTGPMASSSSYDGILNVTSLGAGFVKAPYSNWGSFADLAAPGGSKPNHVLSTLPGNRYGWMAGTSMACPHVSGVAALVVSACGGPGFTPAASWRPGAWIRAQVSAQVRMPYV